MNKIREKRGEVRGIRSMNHIMRRKGGGERKVVNVSHNIKK